MTDKYMMTPDEVEDVLAQMRNTNAVYRSFVEELDAIDDEIDRILDIIGAPSGIALLRENMPARYRLLYIRIRLAGMVGLAPYKSWGEVLDEARKSMLE